MTLQNGFILFFALVLLLLLFYGVYWAFMKIRKNQKGISLLNMIEAAMSNAFDKNANLRSIGRDDLMRLSRSLNELNTTKPG